MIVDVWLRFIFLLIIWKSSHGPYCGRGPNNVKYQCYFHFLIPSAVSSWFSCTNFSPFLTNGAWNCKFIPKTAIFVASCYISRALFLLHLGSPKSNFTARLFYSCFSASLALELVGTFSSAKLVGVTPEISNILCIDLGFTFYVLSRTTGVIGRLFDVTLIWEFKLIPSVSQISYICSLLLFRVCPRGISRMRSNDDTLFPIMSS